ncbi:CUB and sushi domain-containing protein 2-like [Lingula anatina]|uniref:CUB and sushi domain-containing protein 2-like n=1 Tax=Lingula anatina TaxID=7574 RepID=A0A1S3IUQ8_LINAN|nr:CUB and sushi domain-containing protein 2-like [Lingula anatina]|eukprot:XP_013401940.1 CUB and sushi domain-containing protein 2-like [Lingula anatina]
MVSPSWTETTFQIESRLYMPAVTNADSRISTSQPLVIETTSPSMSPGVLSQVVPSVTTNTFQTSSVPVGTTLPSVLENNILSPVSTATTAATGVFSHTETSNNFTHLSTENGTSTALTVPEGNTTIPNTYTTSVPSEFPRVPEIPHASHNTNKTAIGTVVQYTCDEGYTLVSTPTSGGTECLKDGTWSNSDVQCELIVCTIPRDVTEITIVSKPEIILYNKWVVYYCLNGSVFPDGDVRRRVRCVSKTRWIPDFIGCSNTSLSLPDSSRRLGNPRMEAPLAGFIGTFGLAIIGTIIAFIVATDIATIKQHLRLMRKNLGIKRPTINYKTSHKKEKFNQMKGLGKAYMYM